MAPAERPIRPVSPWGVYSSPGFGISAELGGFGSPQLGAANAVFSLDGQITLNMRKSPNEYVRKNLALFVDGGYSHFYGNGFGQNYGGGLIWVYHREKYDSKEIRLGYRVYVMPDGKQQPGIRITWGSGYDGPS